MDQERNSEETGTTLETRHLHPGRVVDLWAERVRFPGGAEGELEIVRHVGAAAAVPVLPDGRVVLVRQYRHATGGWLLEVPAGKLDPGEEAAACARREVEEETGYRVGRLESLGWIWTSPGFTDERIHLYAAYDLEASVQRLEEDEVLEVVVLPLDRAVAIAVSGEMEDAKTICALLRLGSMMASPGSRAAV